MKITTHFWRSCPKQNTDAILTTLHHEIIKIATFFWINGLFTWIYSIILPCKIIPTQGGMISYFHTRPWYIFSERPQGPKDLEQQEHFRQHVSYDAASREGKYPRKYHVASLTPLHITQALRCTHAHNCGGLSMRCGYRHTCAIC